jgi:hypothetical protein
LRRRHPADEVRLGGARAQRRDELGDLLLGAPGGAPEHLVEPRLLEHVLEQAQRREPEPAVGEVVGEHGEAPEELCGGHAPVGRRAAVAEVAHEEGEHRPEAHVRPELPARDLAQAGEELDEAMALLATQLVDPRGQMIGSHIDKIERGERIGHVYTFTARRARRRAGGADRGAG